MPADEERLVPTAPPPGSNSAPEGQPNPRRHRRGHRRSEAHVGRDTKAQRRRGSVAALVAAGSIETADATAEMRGKRLRRSSTGSFKEIGADREPKRTSGTVWIGQLPDSYIDGELKLSKAFARFGKVLTCTVRQKTGYRRHWALLTFVHPSAVNDAVEAGMRGEIAVEDTDGERCVLVVRKAKVDAELRRDDTGALARIWETQNDKIAAAVHIQKTVRGYQTRNKSKHSSKPKQLDLVPQSIQTIREKGQPADTAAVWPKEVTQVVHNFSQELADYIQWLRCEREASQPVVNRRDEILSEMRRAMLAPSRPQLLGVAGAFLALVVLCLVLIGLLAGTASDLSAMEEEAANRQQEAAAAAATASAFGSGALGGRCLVSTIVNAGGGYISTTEAAVGTPFELEVTVSSIDATRCAGTTTVNRVIFTDYASEFSKVVSCVPTASSATPPTGLTAAERPPAVEGVTYQYHSSACSVAADALPLGVYDVQLVHAATVATDVNAGGVAPSSPTAPSAGGYCGVCTGGVKVVGGSTDSVSFNSLGEFSVTVSTACTRGIRSVAVETPGGTWEPCTLTAATRSAITTDTSPRTGSCTLAAPPDTSAYHTYYSSVAVYGDLGVECGRHSPVYCAVNERVQSNACVACDAGSTRAAGDISAGPDTACPETVCGENEYVLSNVCTPCSAGKTRPLTSVPRDRLPSDRPTTASRNNLNLNKATLADTYCWPARCDGGSSNMNDYVSGNSGARRSCSDHSDCCWGLCDATGTCGG